MRDKIYYMLAIAVLLVAIFALVLVLGQDQPTYSQQQAQTGTNMQALFTTLATRVNSDANFSFRVRVAALGDGSAITVSQAETRLVEIGEDYFCLASANQQGRVCYPFAQVIALAVPS